MDNIWMEIQNALNACRGNDTEAVDILPYLAPPDSRNEAVFFLKPELTSSKSVKIDSIIDYINNSFKDYSVEIISACVLSGQYLQNHNIMARHYGTINLVSQEGEKALSPEGKSNLLKGFNKTISEGGKVLGGHQVLEWNKSLTPSVLSSMWDKKNSTSIKLCPGVYGIEFEFEKQKVVVLNGFHPHQLDYYTSPDKLIAVMVVRSDTSWRKLRSNLIGVTNPIEAARDSIRRFLLDNQTKLGISAVNKGLNGVHLSAGPVEAFFEIERFFGSGTDIYSHACLPKSLIDHGMQVSILQELADNPGGVLPTDNRPIFDATEELDMSDAVKLLSQM